MAYDEPLAERVRALMAETPEVTERKMFGGLAFLIGGHMAVVVSGQGGLMVRVDPEDGPRLVDTTPAEHAEMRGREMRGWLRIDGEQLGRERQLKTWVDRGTRCASALPPKG